MEKQEDGQMQQGYVYELTTERRGYGGEIGGRGVKLVRAVGGHDDEGGGTVQITGASPGSNRQLMVIGMVERQVCTEGLGKLFKNAAKRRGRHQSVGNDLQGGGPGCATIRLVVVCPIGSNEENCGRGTHRFSATNHGELGTTEYGRGEGDTSSGGITGSSGDEVDGSLHWMQTGDVGSMGGSAYSFQSL